MTPTPMSRGDYVSLKEHLESRIAAVEKSIVLADTAMHERLKGMNEIREAMRTQSAYFVTRAEMDAKLENLCAKIETLEKYQNTMEGKASQGQSNLALFLALIGTGLGLVGLILRFAGV